MQKLIALLKNKKFRVGILAGVAALIFAVTGRQITDEELRQADEAIEAGVELVAPGGDSEAMAAITEAPGTATGE